MSNSHSQVSTPLPNSLLRGTLQTPLVFQVVDTLSNGFTISRTLWRRLLPVTPPDPDSVDKIPLLGLVSETTGLVRSRWSGSTVTDGELSVFPASNSGDELQDVRLFFGVELGEILVGTHLDGSAV
jgi:hypothetical protein